ncbi:MAG TPA: glycosyltransferase [Candidatus Fermentibacter daniensis]|nr:glycosyltransferase [Candidatus Fermentibacter daniensis]HOF67725.1 glycosyltransferase [Candidatus Fermentibacter daniensis]HOR08318.1 glycosyltransferase [Candidatus Fermentibacter daniensis]HOZ18707.1 glycosyltransferase [Candidatus Fermentibacter daniensis]HPH40608.1 glycosyltransferase [Candidatus Fermentibacter daniensis]
MKHLIGILGFGSQGRVNTCAASLATDKPADSAIWLVNNGADPLAPPAACDYVVHIHEQTRGGFTEALRVFLRQAQTMLCQTATFLNDDLTMEPGCMQAMIDYATQEPHVALVNPMQADAYNPEVIICGGTGPAYPAGIHKVGQRGMQPAPVEDVRWMPFCATTFNLAAVQDIGMPDPNMRIWFSDSDYCLRARLHGWRVVHLGEQGVVRHEHSASVNAMDPAARERQFLADQAAFERKWGGGLLAEYST